MGTVEEVLMEVEEEDREGRRDKISRPLLPARNLRRR